MKRQMEIKRKGISLKICVDFGYNPNPREEDENLGQMVCFHRRYNLGDKTNFKEPFEFNEWYEKHKRNIAQCLPVYLLDHSGLAMSCFDFNDKWDSGQVGYIYCTKKRLKELDMDKLDEMEIKKRLINEVQQYNDYLQGYPPYYYFCIRDENDEIVDTITGFKGTDFKEMIDDMKGYVGEEYHFLFDTLYQKENENCL